MNGIDEKERERIIYLCENACKRRKRMKEKRKIADGTVATVRMIFFANRLRIPPLIGEKVRRTREGPRRAERKVLRSLYTDD